MGTFRMMFGFAQPVKFIKDSRTKLNKTKLMIEKRKYKTIKWVFKATD